MNKARIGILVTVFASMSGLAQASSTITHPTCKVEVSEAVNYRGSGEYTQLFGPLGYAEALKNALISHKGYKETEGSGDNVIRVSLRTSYADFYVLKTGSVYEMEKKTSFCYVDVEAPGISPIGSYQESKNCRRSLKALTDEFPDCVVSP